MIKQAARIQLTMQQLERVLRALEDLTENVLPRDPSLFATLAEAPLEDLSRLRAEVADCLDKMHPTESNDPPDAR